MTKPPSREWRETDTGIHSVWRKVFNADWSSSEVDGPCPVCSAPTLHRWYWLESEGGAIVGGRTYLGRGRLWEWCSTCCTFEYYPDGYVPDWWTAPYSVDADRLQYDPEPIENSRSSLKD
ncbi:L,D-transpeptidase [Streptomyces sp. NPDC049949]|uniref:L,D-transpeptidase n=1 Tax=Streptomyces sp. NPDC049949 TaxID=3154627 RepID=UPI00341A9FDA